MLGFKPCLSQAIEKNLSHRVSKTCAFLGWILTHLKTVKCILGIGENLPLVQ